MILMINTTSRSSSIMRGAVETRTKYLSYLAGKRVRGETIYIIYPPRSAVTPVDSHRLCSCTEPVSRTHARYIFPSHLSHDLISCNTSKTCSVHGYKLYDRWWVSSRKSRYISSRYTSYLHHFDTILLHDESTISMKYFDKNPRNVTDPASRLRDARGDRACCEAKIGGHTFSSRIA
ncbi:unnamed protein product, partial [Pylaiella littoralis]